MNGDLTLYINNNLYVNVTMGAVVKAGGTILQTIVYQRVGNFVSVDMTYSGNTIIVTTNPASAINWIFRGI
jgi:hypothetical protein